MKLLLVEDEKSLSNALKKILEANHYSVDVAYDGQEAMDYISLETYDGIIMDIMMPNMNGFEVLSAMRKAQNETPVLLLSAKSQVDDKVKGLDLGANDYLTKPFSKEELLARIRAMTRVQTTANDVLLKAGNITLNQTTFELSNGSKSFRLANKEYQVMELLMAHPKQAFSTEYIFERIWGYDSDTEVQTVWVYIAYLRKKLVALHATIQIVAHRNTGYTIESVDEVND